MNRLIVPAAAIAAELQRPTRIRQVAYRRSNTGDLSGQQKQVLALVAAGCSYTEVGRRLFLAKGAVNNQLRRVRDKLGVATTGDAVTVARERGLLEGGGHDGQAQAA